MESIVQSIAPYCGNAGMTAIGMFAVYLLIQTKRKKSREEIDNSASSLEKEIALLKQRIEATEKRLDEGNEKFNSMDVTLRNINSSIERLTGMVEMFFRSQGLGGGK